MSKPKPPLQNAINNAVATFTTELVAIIRQATVSELAGLTDGPKSAAGKAPAPRPIPVVALAPVEAPEPAAADDGLAPAGREQDEVVERAREAPTAPAKTPRKAKKKRAWPTCAAPGCTAKMYGPSGPNKMCYRHHVEAGGGLSPFARRKKAVPAASTPDAAEPDAERKARKVIRRKKGEQKADDAPPADPSLRLETVANPPLAAKDDGLRQVEARLARKKS